MTPNPEHMLAAINAAKDARKQGDYAVGCVIAAGDDIIAVGGNRTHLEHDPTLHAELIAIRQAARKQRQKNLTNCVLYATHEPCPMCMGAIIWARIACVVYGASMEDHKDYRDHQASKDWKWRVIDVRAEHIAARGDPVVKLIPGFMRQECLTLFHS